jgi:hypothetical protein
MNSSERIIERETAQIVRGEAWQRAVGDAKLPADGKL